MSLTYSVRWPLLLALLLCIPRAGLAQSERPTITLAVDATEVARRVLHARETISARPGPLTLLYPQWIPGEHGPTGPVVDVAGLKIAAGGKTMTWRRDLENMYGLHVVVPPGETTRV